MHSIYVRVLYQPLFMRYHKVILSVPLWYDISVIWRIIGCRMAIWWVKRMSAFLLRFNDLTSRHELTSRKARNWIQLNLTAQNRMPRSRVFDKSRTGHSTADKIRIESVRWMERESRIPPFLMFVRFKMALSWLADIPLVQAAMPTSKPIGRYGSRRLDFRIDLDCFETADQLMLQPLAIFSSQSVVNFKSMIVSWWPTSDNFQALTFDTS